jgi:hypothetical protein
MRADNFTGKIYRIQHLSGNKWTYSSLDHFGYPPGFNASGVCWQQTGIDGVLDFSEAIQGLAWIAAKHPDRQFRIVRHLISWQTESVMTMDSPFNAENHSE